jgi:hypothetical protein
MKLSNLQIGMRVRSREPGRNFGRIGKIQDLFPTYATILWDVGPNNAYTFTSVWFTTQIETYLEPENAKPPPPNCKRDQVQPGTQLQSIDRACRYGETVTVRSITPKLCMFVWDDRQADGIYTWSWIMVENTFGILTGGDAIAAPHPASVAKPDDFKKLYDFFASVSQKGCCSKCAAPMPCAYHP